MVTSSDTCSATVTAAACPCQVLFVPASCSCTRRGLLTIIVKWTCSTSSFAITSCRVVQGLVSRLLLWLAVLPGSLKLAYDGRPETPVSNPVQCGRRLIGPKSLRAKCSASGLGRPSLGEGYLDGVASLV